MTDRPPIADLTREATRKARRLANARLRPTDVWSTLTRVVGLGWVLVLPLALGAALGRLAARGLGRPWIALVGLLLGLVTGAYGVFRQVKLGLSDDDSAPPDEHRNDRSGS